MEQNEPEKKMPSMHANAIRRSAKDLELLALGNGRVGGREGYARGHRAARAVAGARRSPRFCFQTSEKRKGKIFEGLKSWHPPAGSPGAHLSIHLSAQSAFFATQGMFCMAWKRYVFCAASLMYRR